MYNLFLSPVLLLVFSLSVKDVTNQTEFRSRFRHCLQFTPPSLTLLILPFSLPFSHLVCLHPSASRPCFSPSCQSPSKSWLSGPLVIHSSFYNKRDLFKCESHYGNWSYPPLPAATTYLKVFNTPLLSVKQTNKKEPKKLEMLNMANRVISCIVPASLSSWVSHHFLPHFMCSGHTGLLFLN